MGHGHVTPNPDGSKARCGGPGFCPVCQTEQNTFNIKNKAWLESNPKPEPALDEKDRVNLGVIEFHSEKANPGLIDRFYAVTKDLEESASIVDLWLMDIATVLGEFGYDMRIYRKPEKARGR